MRVITVPMKDNPTVTVLVMVEAGSKYETKEINGLFISLSICVSRYDQEAEGD